MQDASANQMPDKHTHSAYALTNSKQFNKKYSLESDINECRRFLNSVDSGTRLTKNVWSLQHVVYTPEDELGFNPVHAAMLWI